MAEHLPDRQRPGERAQGLIVPDGVQPFAYVRPDVLAVVLGHIAPRRSDTAQQDCVICTPHIGGSTKGSLLRAGTIAATNIVRHLRGEAADPDNLAG